MSFALGEIVRLPLLTFSDANEATPADPDAITIDVTHGDGSTSTANYPGTIVKDSQGVYHLDVPADSVGFWTAHATATGAVATAEDYAWEVRPAGGTFPWRPDLTTVASYIPERTVTVTAPGVEDPVGTFTHDTTPTADQASTLIDAATRHVSTKVGTVNVLLYEQARDAAAMRAAGLIELSYPVRDASLNVGRDWIKLAADAVADLQTANADPTAPTRPDPLLPIYSFPDAPSYGDTPL